VARTDGWLERHHFLLRRLHSLTGVAPIGVFLLFHLTTNASIVWGRVSGGGAYGGHGGVTTFQHEVNFIHSLPALLLIEIFGLWLPLIFHSLLGIVYAAGGRSNVSRYGYQDNWRYSLQRVSGYVGFLFIFYHVATLRWGWTFLVPGGTEWKAEYAASTMAAALRGGEAGITPLGYLVSAFYMVGVSLLVFHLANGLWTAAITWGLTISEKAQRRWGQVCAAIGFVLMGMAWAGVIGFATLGHTEARLIEDGILGGHGPETDAGGPAPDVASAPDPEATRPGS